jgi:hypothetical protein
MPATLARADLLEALESGSLFGTGHAGRADGIDVHQADVDLELGVGGGNVHEVEDLLAALGDPGCPQPASPPAEPEAVDLLPRSARASGAATPAGDPTRTARARVGSGPIETTMRGATGDDFPVMPNGAARAVPAGGPQATASAAPASLASPLPAPASVSPPAGRDGQDGDVAFFDPGPGDGSLGEPAAAAVAVDDRPTSAAPLADTMPPAPRVSRFAGAGLDDDRLPILRKRR